MIATNKAGFDNLKSSMLNIFRNACVLFSAIRVPAMITLALNGYVMCSTLGLLLKTDAGLKRKKMSFDPKNFIDIKDLKAIDAFRTKISIVLIGNTSIPDKVTLTPMEDNDDYVPYCEKCIEILTNVLRLNALLAFYEANSSLNLNSKNINSELKMAYSKLLDHTLLHKKNGPSTIF